MNSAGSPHNPYDAPAVRHRWIFLAFIIVWILLAVAGVALVIYDIRNHVPFNLTFLIGPFFVILMAAMLIRVGRLRRSAPPRR